MFTILVMKEIRSIFYSPKFVSVVSVCSFLVLLSVFVGIRDYRSSVRRFEAANNLVHQEMREARQWASVTNRIYREPNPLQIFSSGVEYDIGRFSTISSWQPVKLVHSAYSDDPIYAVFRFIDFSFIVQVVLTLLAILFTYNAINGERESGTLQLALSNAIPRSQYVSAKFVGAWLGIMIPIALSMVVGLSLLVVYQIPMTGYDWVRLAFLLGVSVLLVTFFTAYGIFVSSVTRHSNVSFLISLVSWVAFVLIIPRAGVMLAGQLVRVATDAEMKTRYDLYAKDRWNQQMDNMTKVWKGRMDAMQGLTDDQRRAKQNEMRPQWDEEDNSGRETTLRDIDENGRKLNEQFRNEKLEQQRTAFALSRLSPVSSYQLAVMNLAGTDIDLKNRYEDALNSFRTTFNNFKDRKQKESGGGGGLRISVDSQTGIKIDVGREIALDLSNVPQFVAAAVPLMNILGQAAIDYGLLLIYSLLAFAGAFLVFQQYDVR
jgi:ABC-type transport system involved in multi-copper enzyme maturation permease subunit